MLISLRAGGISVEKISPPHSGHRSAVRRPEPAPSSCPSAPSVDARELRKESLDCWLGNLPNCCKAARAAAKRREPIDYRLENALLALGFWFCSLRRQLFDVLEMPLALGRNFLASLNGVCELFESLCRPPRLGIGLERRYVLRDRVDNLKSARLGERTYVPVNIRVAASPVGLH
jgi:hypothetical protein